MRLLPLLGLALSCSGAPLEQPATTTTVAVERPAAHRPRDSAKPRPEAPIPVRQRRSPRQAPEEEAASEEGSDDDFGRSPFGNYPGPTGGPDCDALADCCNKMAQQQGGLDPRMCDQMRTFPSSICPNILAQFRQQMTQLGVRCGP